MLAKTAGGLFWMFRYLERSENNARLAEAGFRIALTRTGGATEDEWASVVKTTGNEDVYLAHRNTYDGENVVDFLLRDPNNPDSVINVIENARTNARLVRTAITREVWESVNHCWMTLKEALADPVKEAQLPYLLSLIRQESALVRGAMHGTMLRNDMFSFARLGTFIERADNTARILDVKYYVLLPKKETVGSDLDIAQWDTILRAASATRAFRMIHGADMSPLAIADFLLFDHRMPRSLAFCYNELFNNLEYLGNDYNEFHDSYKLVATLQSRMRRGDIKKVFNSGLHEFIQSVIADNQSLSGQIVQDYRFLG